MNDLTPGAAPELTGAFTDAQVDAINKMLEQNEWDPIGPGWVDAIYAAALRVAEGGTGTRTHQPGTNEGENHCAVCGEEWPCWTQRRMGQPLHPGEVLNTIDRVREWVNRGTPAPQDNVSHDALLHDLSVVLDAALAASRGRGEAGTGTAQEAK